MVAEQLRNLGTYTFADVASYRLGQKEIRTLAAVVMGKNGKKDQLIRVRNSLYVNTIVVDC